jgi:predicted DNA-binding protein YlxM (UPF0122 family)
MTELSNLTEKAGLLFKKYGVKSITMADISTELGVSKKTLYQLIPDKHKLIDQVIKKEYMYYKARLKHILSLDIDPVLQFIKINHLSNEFLLDYSPVLEFDLKKYYNSVYVKAKKIFFRLFQSAIKKSIEYGKEIEIYREDINSEILSKLCVSRIGHASKNSIIPINDFVSEPYQNEFLNYHFNGMVNRKGVYLLSKYMNERKSKKL